MAGPEEFVQRAEELRETIRYHDERYYGQDEPEICHEPVRGRRQY